MVPGREARPHSLGRARRRVCALRASPAAAYVRTTTETSGVAVQWNEKCIVVTPDERGSKDSRSPTSRRRSTAPSTTGWSTPRSAAGCAVEPAAQVRARRRQRRAAGGHLPQRRVAPARTGAARSVGDRPDHRDVREHARPARRRHHPRRRHRAQQRQLHVHHRSDQRDAAAGHACWPISRTR